MGCEGEVPASEGEEDDPPRVAHDDGGGRVLVVGEEQFDRGGVGAEAVEEVVEVGIEFGEAIRDRGLGIEAEDAGLDEAGARGVRGGGGLHAAVAGDAEPGIDAEESHGV